MSKSSKRNKARASRGGASESNPRQAEQNSESTRQEARANDLSRVEIVLIVAILACGIALRVAFPEFPEQLNENRFRYCWKGPVPAQYTPGIGRSGTSVLRDQGKHLLDEGR